MAEVARKTKRYPSGVMDEAWERKRKPIAGLQEMLNAIRYLAHGAGGWRILPVHFSPWQTVCWWFRRFVRCILFRTIHDVVLMLEREVVGREASPSGGMLDNQAVKARPGTRLRRRQAPRRDGYGRAAADGQPY